MRVVERVRGTAVEVRAAEKGDETHKEKARFEDTWFSSVHSTPSDTNTRCCWALSCLYFSSAMHHFTSTPVPSTSTKCRTLSTALSLFHLSFLSPDNSGLCFLSLSLPSSIHSTMRQNWSSPPLPSLFPLSYSVLSGEADRPHSTGRPRRPFLTRLSVTPLPHPSISPL